MKITLKRMNDVDYQAADTFFHSSDIKQITKDYFNYVYTSALDYLDTGDLNVLNRVVTASKFVTKVRVTAQLLSLVACHKTVAGKYKGKANPKRLKMMRAKTGELKGKMEAIINRDHEQKEAKAATFDADQAQTRAVNAIAALLAHDVAVDVSELVKLATQQKDKVKTKAVKAAVGPVSATAMTPDF